jgi:hypothetical protein
MAAQPFETAEGSEFPCCRQLSVFVENRLGQLLRLTRVLDGEPIRIMGLAVEGSVDCAIARLLVNDPDTAVRMISQAGFAVTQTDVIVIQLPAGKRGILAVCAALIAGEININYAFPLLCTKDLGACLVIQVDNVPQATAVLATHHCRLLDQSDL